MRAIIIGCGRVGVLLARLLEQEGHHVTIVDKSPAAFRNLGRDFRGRTITGIGFDRDVLRQAGIERADAFAAVTSGDNSNFIAATVARDTYRVPIVIARIYDPQREQIYRRLGIRTISSTAWGAHTIKRLMIHSGMQSSEELGNGEVQVMEARVSGVVAGRSIRDLTYTGEVSVFAVVRNGQAFVPTPASVLEEGDIVHLSVAANAVNKIETLIR